MSQDEMPGCFRAAKDNLRSSLERAKAGLASAMDIVTALEGAAADRAGGGAGVDLGASRAIMVASLDDPGVTLFSPPYRSPEVTRVSSEPAPVKVGDPVRVTREDFPVCGQQGTISELPSISGGTIHVVEIASQPSHSRFWCLRRCEFDPIPAPAPGPILVHSPSSPADPDSARASATVAVGAVGIQA